MSDKLTSTAVDFISHNRHGYLATVDLKSVPHIALVYCLVKPDLTLYFMTRVESRKYENLILHPTVSMSFTDLEKKVTLQLTGKAKRLDSLSEEQEIMLELTRDRNKEDGWIIPPMQLFESGDTNEIAIIKIVAKEMVYADFHELKNGKYKPTFSKVV